MMSRGEILTPTGFVEEPEFRFFEAASPTFTILANRESRANRLGQLGQFSYGFEEVR